VWNDFVGYTLFSTLNIIQKQQVLLKSNPVLKVFQNRPLLSYREILIWKHRLEKLMPRTVNFFYFFKNWTKFLIFEKSWLTPRTGSQGNQGKIK